MDFIDPNIDDSSAGVKKIRVYNIQSPEERERYEKIINDPKRKILKETDPTVDKSGRVLVVLKWIELS